MTDLSTFRVTIGFTDEMATDDERETAALRLRKQLGDLELDNISRVPEVAPDGSKELGFLTGFLMTKLNTGNAKKLFEFLSDRLSGKTIELEVEGNGEKLKVKASSREELQLAIAEAEKFIQD